MVNPNSIEELARLIRKRMMLAAGGTLKESGLEVLVEALKAHGESMRREENEACAKVVLGCFKGKKVVSHNIGGILEYAAEAIRTRLTQSRER